MQLLTYKEVIAMKKVISTRKTCKSRGTGLSHYILLPKKGK